MKRMKEYRMKNSLKKVEQFNDRKEEQERQVNNT